MIVEPADRSSIVAASGPPQFVPAAQLEQSKQQLAAVASRTSPRPSMSTRAPIRCRSNSITASRPTKRLSTSQAIYHDDKFTYIKTNAPEKFSVYEMRDGKPNLITYELNNGTYIIPKVMDSGYVELGKKRLEFTRKG